MNRKGTTKKKTDICETYRRVLEMPELTDTEIEEFRKPIISIAQTICEHVWGKKFY